MAEQTTQHACHCGSDLFGSERKKKIDIFEEIDKMTDYLDSIGEDKVLEIMNNTIAELDAKKES